MEKTPVQSSGGKKITDTHGEAIRRVAGGKELSPQGLIPGDLIFKYSGEQLLHVSIVTATDAEAGAADHAHHLNDAVLIGLHETTVTSASNLVVRCRHAPLRKAAAEFARRWTELAMPYSNHRRRAAMVHEAQSGGDVVAIQRKLFDQVGKFRAIKFAARRSGDLIYPSEKDPRIEGNRGMFCSMFVAVCYQVAGLQELVREAPTGLRVSDKSTTKKDLKKSKATFGAVPKPDRQQFESYLGRLTEVDPYELYDFGSDDAKAVALAVRKADKRRPTRGFGAVYQPSLAFWRDDRGSIATCNWAQFITKGMMLDAKVIMPDGMLKCLLDDLGDSGGWEVMGVLGKVGAYLRPKPDEDRKRLDQQKKTDTRFPRPLPPKK